VDGNVILQVGCNTRRDSARRGEQIEKDEIGGECSTHGTVKLDKI
jgi:hypothetical protein